MIGQLRGKLINKQPPILLIDVQGVGYEVAAPMSTFYLLPETGEDIVLRTHLVVREDAQLLYGFATDSERNLFRALIRISGVGPKLALTILSGIEAETFVRVIREGDSAALTRLPGVGKKTAERLIVEMRDRLEGLGVAQDNVLAASQGVQTPMNPVNDAVSALIALGYKPQDASRHVNAIEAEGLGSSDIIRLALKDMVR